MALIPYYSQLLVLLNHVVIVLMYVVLRVLRKIDAYLISTPVNKSLYITCIIIIISSSSSISSIIIIFIHNTD